MEQNRLAMLLAVLHRHGGVPVLGQDVFVAVVEDGLRRVEGQAVVVPRHDRGFLVPGIRVDVDALVEQLGGTKRTSTAQGTQISITFPAEG